MKKSLLAALGVLLIVGCGAPPPPAAPDTKVDDKTGTATSTGAAADKDTDGDGIPDSADKCPDAKEDGLGSEPKDGCPNKPWSRSHPSPP